MCCDSLDLSIPFSRIQRSLLHPLDTRQHVSEVYVEVFNHVLVVEDLGDDALNGWVKTYCYMRWYLRTSYMYVQHTHMQEFLLGHLKRKHLQPKRGQPDCRRGTMFRSHQNISQDSRVIGQWPHGAGESSLTGFEVDNRRGLWMDGVSSSKEGFLEGHIRDVFSDIFFWIFSFKCYVWFR